MVFLIMAMCMLLARQVEAWNDLNFHFINTDTVILLNCFVCKSIFNSQFESWMSGEKKLQVASWSIEIFLYQQLHPLTILFWNFFPKEDKHIPEIFQSSCLWRLRTWERQTVNYKKRGIKRFAWSWWHVKVHIILKTISHIAFS